MQVIRWDAKPKAAWKNGQGMTTELAIEPPEARFPHDDFVWRLSCATVAGPNDFSLFPGYQRLLLVWKGSGLRLNGKALAPLRVHRWSGDEAVHCETLGAGTEEVVDFGLIYKGVRAQMEVLNSEDREMTAGETLFVFCVQGVLLVNGERVEAGALARLEEPGAYRMRAANAAGVGVRVLIQKT